MAFIIAAKKSITNMSNEMELIGYIPHRHDHRLRAAFANICKYLRVVRTCVPKKPSVYYRALSHLEQISKALVRVGAHMDASELNDYISTWRHEVVRKIAML
jgi:iron-sulfur cluster repair protein YtfE (RIC family)